MAVKYTKLPMADLDFECFDYKSVYDYEPPMSKNKKKYASIYDYTGDQKLGDNGCDMEITSPQSFLCRCCTKFLVILVYLLVFITIPISGWFCFKRINQYERLVVFRLGHLMGIKTPGIVIILPIIDYVVKVDLRMKAFSVPPQKILTCDNAAIEVGAEVYYLISEPVMFVNSIKDLDASTRALCQTTLVTHLAKQALSDIETNKINLGQILQEHINKSTRKWGVEVNRIDISQVKVIQGPPDTTGNTAQNLLNMVAPGLLPAGSNSNMNPAQGLLGGLGGLLPQFGQGAMAQPKSEQMPLLAAGMFPGASAGPTQSQFPSMFAAEASQSERRSLNTPQDLIAAVKQHLGPDLVAEFGLVYSFKVSGNGGGTFFLDLKHGSGCAGTGQLLDINPDAILNLSVDTLRGIMSGEQSSLSAYMGGQLQIEGDLQGAMRLAQLVDRIK